MPLSPSLRRHRSIYDDQVAIVDADARHRVAIDPHDVAGSRMFDGPCAQVDGLLRVVLGRRGDPAGVLHRKNGNSCGTSSNGISWSDAPVGVAREADLNSLSVPTA